VAKAYGDMNEAGIALVERIAGELGIECELARGAHVTFTAQEAKRASFQQEVEVAQELGACSACDEAGC
jgi:hypothetical protein